MDSISLPDTLRSEEYVNLWNVTDHDNYTAVIYFKECLSDAAIYKLDSLVDISDRYGDGYNTWYKSNDTFQLSPPIYIPSKLEWVKSKDVLYQHFMGGLDASVTYWIYEDMIIAEAESSRYPDRFFDAGFFIVLVTVFLPWGLLLGLIKLLNLKVRKDENKI
jgi:hypothetical protein